MTKGIAVARPLLPDAEALVPYLREIDRSRIYANRGPLNSRFETRLARHIGASSEDMVALAANATVALAATLMAFDAPRGNLCVVPAWTFSASAHAIVQAGLTPWIVDVDPADGTLAPSDVLRWIEDAPRAIGAVMCVAPFGRPVDVTAWTEFRLRTGIPVVLDAAGGFDSVRAGAIPTVVSLHATKVLGIGEGAFVTSTDAALVREVRRRMNFGFAGSRRAAVAATNGKPSEYAAAVGLAALDAWPGRRADFVRVAQRYRDALALRRGVTSVPQRDEHWVSATTIVSLPAGAIDAVEQGLRQAGIESRRWYGDGLTAHRAFDLWPRTPIPVTERLAATVLGLPCWPDLPDTVVDEIASIVAAAATPFDSVSVDAIQVAELGV